MTGRAHVDVDTARAPSFGLADDHAPFRSAWHRHRRHQLLYAARGALRLEAGGAQWLLPPQRAAWIPARCEHRVSASVPVALRTLYLAPALGAGLARDCAVFELPPLGRELVLHAMRFGPDAKVAAAAARVFGLLASLCGEWIAAARPWRLPAPRTPEVERAMTFTLAHLDRKLAIGEVCKRAALSPRSLERRFVDETGASWRTFAQQARIVRAMELLAAPGARVTEVGMAVGFDSPGAFSRAFRAVAGETPRAYRARASFPDKSLADLPKRPRR